VPADGAAEPAEAGKDSTTGARPPARAGRNLPAAVGVGLLLGGLAIVTLFTVKATFLVYLAAAVGIALWELSRALGTRDIRLPLVPLAAGSVAAIVLAYWGSGRALMAALALTMIAIMAWRLPGGTAGYLRDVTAGAFALGYLPLMASFVALMLAAPDGSRRVLVFLILVVCSDVGGYVTGILIGRHLMVPVISPKKTWEGFAGSALACAAAGAITLPLLLHGAAWPGLLVGVGALLGATLGDLTESMIKRDLEIKDMGTVLPGHGGVLDRLDSLALAAPVVWLLLLVFVPVAGHR
jgi:phosphatidate cytidylyltransferase